MHQINLNLSDSLYHDLQQRAAEAGFANVNDYVTDLLQDDLKDENLDRFFTPERLAHIDRAAAEIDAGLGITLEESDVRLRKSKDEWLRQKQ